MKTYTVYVEYKNRGTVNVEAEGREDLIKKLRSKEFVDELPLPQNEDYVDGTYIIDWKSTFKDGNIDE